MPISFVPHRGLILICDFDLAHIIPEMTKQRRVVVLSPRSYNRRHGDRPGRCLVVPFSATAPRVLRPSYVHFSAGEYQSLTKEVWACCDSITAVSHARLELVFADQTPLNERLSDVDLRRIEEGVCHATGVAIGGPSVI